MVRLSFGHPLTQGNERTNLTASAASGASTLTAYSVAGFSVGTYITLGAIGQDRSEILLIHTSTVPSGSTITLNATTTYAHAEGEEVVFIPWNRIEIGTSTDGTTWSVLATVAIQAENNETVYYHSAGTSSTYYRYRYNNQQDGTFSDYSDSIQGVGLGDNTVGAIIGRALDETNEQISDVISRSFLVNALAQGRREAHRRMRRWSFRRDFDYDAGNLTTGQFSVAMPTVIADRQTNRDVFGVWVETRRKMRYLPKSEWDTLREGAVHSTLAAQASSGATSITLSDASDFGDTGTINFSSNTGVSYTTINRTTGVLSGIPASGTGSITTTTASGTDVWQNVSYGEPLDYTVYDSTVSFWPPVSSDFNSRNIFMDIYEDVAASNSDADELDEPYYDMFVNYLAYRIKKKKAQGVLPTTDNDYQEYQYKLEAQVLLDYSGQPLSLYPDIDHLERGD